MAKPIPTPEGAVLRFFRTSKGVSEARLASLNGVTTQTLRRWEKTLASADRLIAVLSWIDVPPEAVETALLAHRLGSAPPEPGLLAGPSGERQRLIQRATAAGGRSGAEATQAELTRLCSLQQAPFHRRWADGVWSRLKKVPAAKQALVADAAARDDRSWALAERLCLASVVMAAHRADESLRLARLAVNIADKSRLADRSRLRLLGWCRPFLANSLRVGGDLKAAEAAFAHADEQWKQGEGGDPSGILDGARRLDLKASLLMYQEGKFEKVQSLLNEALNRARTKHARGRILLKQARSLELVGRYEAAIEVLLKAEPLIDPRREPRLLCVLHFNRAVSFCHLDRYQEAMASLPLIEAMAEYLRTELDGVRLWWLRGRTWDGLGRREEALAAFARVHAHFEKEKIPYDFALVSLELAALHLERGHTSRVRELAEGMLWIFRDQRVHKEALAAISLFCQAAKLGSADAEWTRRLVRYLYRAEHNPILRFEG